MKFVLTVSDGAKQWDEDYDVPMLKTADDVRDYCETILSRFNSGRRPGELPRHMVSLEIGGDSDVHDWRKVNAATVMKGTSNYDVMRCAVCGVTGKRYGLGSTVRRDHGYRAKRYENCRWKGGSGG